jgi:epoxyqueuosine reductase
MMTKQAIQRRARELGFDACRITSAAPPQTAAHFENWLSSGCHGEMAYLQRNAAKRVDPDRVLAGARSIVTLAASYAAPAAGPAKEGEYPIYHGPKNLIPGVIARYAQHDDYHDVLGLRLKDLTAFVNGLGGPLSRSLWYVDTGPLLERDLAERAGLGFIGKHTNLISRQLGNWFFLAEIITSLELEPDLPEHNRCGSCTRCLAACPTQAITAPFQLDARRCISYLTIELKGPIPVELRPLIGNRIYGCDDCLAACPWNRFARQGQIMRNHTRPDLSTPDLSELLALDEAAFRQRFANTPLLRPKRRGLLRNVCVALGNIRDARALPVLQRAASDSDPLVAEHALWAIGRIQAAQRRFMGQHRRRLRSSWSFSGQPENYISLA